VHQKNVGKLRAQEKQLQNDTVEPPEETPPAAAAPATEPAADPAASAAPAGAPKAGKNGAQKRRARNATPNGATE
ncbi:aminodeoxychorismate lyase, partial [Rhodopseudomonas sp. BR0C11]|nr:aminodeoxychorismate lyase [Rhodopseudomonas sp. BR0C11]